MAFHQNIQILQKQSNTPKSISLHSKLQGNKLRLFIQGEAMNIQQLISAGYQGNNKSTDIYNLN